MDAKTPALIIVSLVCLAALASAQGEVPMRGQDNEFGSIRTPYTLDFAGDRVPIEAQVLLKKMYEDKEATFYMFAFTVEHTPLDVTFDNLIRADTGQEMPCFKREGTGRDQLKCFVDRKDMPAVGTEIVMRGTVGSSKQGSFQVGAIVVPFTYTWFRVPMSNGLDAELFGYTTVNSTVGGLGGGGNPFRTPGLGAVGVATAAGIAVGLLALARRKRT